jgi:hypothetical protein
MAKPKSMEATETTATETTHGELAAARAAAEKVEQEYRELSVSLAQKQNERAALSRAVTSPPPDQSAEELGEKMTIRERYDELRRFTETTRAGARCKNFALWNCAEQLCASHFHKKRGPELTHEEREKRNRQRQRPTCDCQAYAWPHRPGAGLCRWPLDPVENHPTPAGGIAPGKLRRRKIRAALKRMGQR